MTESQSSLKNIGRLCFFLDRSLISTASLLHSLLYPFTIDIEETIYGYGYRYGYGYPYREQVIVNQFTSFFVKLPQTPPAVTLATSTGGAGSNI